MSALLRGKWPVIVEDAVILLCILVLWPAVLGWEGLAFRILQWIALACLVVILTRRVRRIAKRHTG